MSTGHSRIGAVAGRKAVPGRGIGKFKSRAAALMMVLTLIPGATAAQQGPTVYGLSPFYGTPPAPELSLLGLDSARYALSKYRGSVVVVNFWATWCPPCVAEMPTLQRLWESLHDENFEILAVNLGEEPGTIHNFLDRFRVKIGFPVLLARDQSIMERWRIAGLPMTYVVDTRGRWAYQVLGPRDFSHPHIVTRIRKLMQVSE